MNRWNFYNNNNNNGHENDNRNNRQKDCADDKRACDCGCQKDPCADECSCDCDCSRCPPGPQGPAGGVLGFAEVSTGHPHPRQREAKSLHFKLA